MSEPWNLLSAPVWAALILLGLWFSLSRREHWLVACLLLALAYVSLSLGLERRVAADWMLGLRWGLFLATLAVFIRYRWHPERPPSAKPADAADRPGQPPEEQ